MTNQNALLYSIEDTQKIVPVGRQGIYNLVHKGELELVKISRRSFITDVSIRAYIERLRDVAAKRTSLADDAAANARSKKVAMNISSK